MKCHPAPTLTLHDLQGMLHVCARAAEASRILHELDIAERAGCLSKSTIAELDKHIYARQSWHETRDMLGFVLQGLAYALDPVIDHIADQEV